MTFLKALLTLFALMLALPSAAQVVGPPGTTRHLKSELIAEGPAVPGETLFLAIKFNPDEGWHGYWSNPGDAGYGICHAFLEHVVQATGHVATQPADLLPAYQ